MRKMRVALAMAVIGLELLILAAIAPLGIDRALQSCRFLGRPENLKNLKNPAPIEAHECKNRRIFVYELPPKFNADLLRDCERLEPWRSMCPAVSNSGLGPLLPPQEQKSSPLPILHRLLSIFRGAVDLRRWPAESRWHATDQFIGDVIVHSRLLRHRCRTADPRGAAAFFIPFYAALDISRYLWSDSSSDRENATRNLDSLGRELLEWLQQQPEFVRSGGADHFLMAGRISWDFRRMPLAVHDWGSSLFHRAEMQNVTRLVVERSPWDDSDVGVPYPTAFHPASDSDLEKWLEFVKSSQRENLFAFAGSSRPGFRGDPKTDFRKILLEQCRAVQYRAARRSACLDCAEGDARCVSDPLSVTRLFLGSVFCLQPRGDSYTRKSIFDALIAGCIPVFFWNQSAYWQYQLYLPAEAESYSVFIPHSAVRDGKLNVWEVLSGVSEESVRTMQQQVLRIIPGVIYASSSLRQWRDAVDIAMDGVLNRIGSLGLDFSAQA